MSGRARRLPASASPPAPARPDLVALNAAKLFAELLTRIDAAREGERIVPFCRKSELIPPFSESQINRWLHERKLRAVRLGRLTLIEIASVRELLETATPWTPENGEIKNEIEAEIEVER